MYSMSQFGLDTFQVLRSHMWLVATVLVQVHIAPCCSVSSRREEARNFQQLGRKVFLRYPCFLSLLKEAAGMSRLTDA